MNWYDRITGASNQPQYQAPSIQNNGYSGVQFQNPVQKMNYIMQAMRDPSSFVRNAIPGLPIEIANDPDKILNYMKQNCGVTDADIQYAASQIPKGW